MSPAISVLSTSQITADGGAGNLDFFSFRTRLDSDGTAAVDLSTCTLETGEPNGAGYTKTVWYELPLDFDATETARVTLSSLTSTGTVSIYKSLLPPDLESDDDDPVALSDLALVQAALADQRLPLDSDYDAPYYLQVGLLTGTGADFTLSWGDADPTEGGTFDGAIQTGGAQLFETVSSVNAWLEPSEPIPAGITPIRSIWLLWVAPEADLLADPDISQYIQARTDQTTNFSVSIYTPGTGISDLTLLGESAAAGPGAAEISLVPTPGATYMVQVTTESDTADFGVEFYTAGGTVVPAEIVTHLRAEIYKNDGLTLITEIPHKVAAQFQEPLNIPGNGSLTMRLDDPLLAAYATSLDPFDLVNYGNIVKFWMGTKCVSGFVIKNREATLLTDSEKVGEVIIMTGPTVHFVLDNFMVRHDGDTSDRSTSVRSYSWRSMPGEWFDASVWDDHINTDSMQDPPGGKHGQTAKKRPKYGMLERKKPKWPDIHAKWMWISQNPKKNEGNWKPKRKIKGLHYYRTTISVPHGGRSYEISAAADDHYEVWVDGELFLSNDGHESFTQFKKRKLNFTKGKHTIAVNVRDKGKVSSGDRNDAFLFTLQRLNDKGKVVATLKRSGKKWKAWHGPRPPGWNRAMIMRNVVQEARARNIATAQNIGIGGWDEKHDADGQKWRDKTDMQVKIGTSALDLQSQFSESGVFDVWVDPATMQLQCYVRRGVNRSQSVALAPGYNLQVWSVNEADDVKNVILAQYHGGFVSARSPGSVAEFGAREGYLEFGGLREEGPAKALLTSLLNTLGRVTHVGGSPDTVWHREAYSGSLIAVAGATPFLDFNVGDTVMAPGQDKVLHPHRVLSLTCTEDVDGNLTFDPELGTP